MGHFTNSDRGTAIGFRRSKTGTCSRVRVVDYRMDELSREEAEAERDLYGPFTESLRGLVDAAIRTTVPADEIRRAHAEIEAITERLRAAPMRTTYGVDLRTDGRGRAWGNAVVGLRNAIAPPLTVVQEGRGVRSSFSLGAAYEGPPGSVHGGVLALVLDQLLGEAAGAGGKPGMTDSPGEPAPVLGERRDLNASVGRFRPRSTATPNR